MTSSGTDTEMTGPAGEDTVDIDEFNTSSDDAVEALLASCLGVPGWIEEVMAGRPYDDVAGLLSTARAAAASLDAGQVEIALARHPRIGESAGDGHDREFSTREQAGFDRDDSDLVAAMSRGNAAYEQQFGRVFLIRAAGRDADEILAELRRRLTNSPDAELLEVVRELGEIAVLRLGLLVVDNGQDTAPTPTQGSPA